jgi:glycosyltransferase involved in cell wall biosynthesis
LQTYSASTVEGHELQQFPNGTVVVIVKNAKSSIRRCIESLLGQTVNLEVVVVDGNSTDGTRDILRELPVKMVTAPEKDSYGISRNLGVKNSSGQVILFMDADDYAEPKWAEALLKHFEGRSNVGIVSVPRRVAKFEGWFMKTLSYEYAAEVGEDTKTKSKPSWESVTTKGTAWLKRAILEAGGFDGAMFFGTEDKDLGYRISKLGYAVEEEPLAEITVTPVGGAKNFIKDKFWRAGVGHGYLRRKCGLFRPPLSGVLSVALLLAGLILLLPFSETLLAVCSFVLAVLVSKSVISEGVKLHEKGAPTHHSIAFGFMKWLSRIIEAFGFVVGYLGFSWWVAPHRVESERKGETEYPNAP